MTFFAVLSDLRIYFGWIGVEKSGQQTFWW